MKRNHQLSSGDLPHWGLPDPGECGAHQNWEKAEFGKLSFIYCITNFRVGTFPRPYRQRDTTKGRVFGCFNDIQIHYSRSAGIIFIKTILSPPPCFWKSYYFPNEFFMKFRAAFRHLKTNCRTRRPKLQYFFYISRPQKIAYTCSLRAQFHVHLFRRHLW